MFGHICCTSKNMALLKLVCNFFYSSGKCFHNVQPLEVDISNKIEMLEILERSRKVSDIDELVLQEILQAHELVVRRRSVYCMTILIHSK